MFKMLIQSDSEKIKREGKYNIKEFNSILRNACLDSEFKESSPGHYYLPEGSNELGAMFLLEVQFRNLGYIIPNLSKWITWSDREGEVNELA